MGMVVAVLSLIVGLAGLMGVVLILLWVRRPVGREMEQALRDELRISREESTRQARDSREEVATTLESVRKTTEEKLAAGGELQRRGIEDLKMSMTALTDTIRGEMTSHRDRVQTQLQAIQSTNEQRFEKVRETVIQHLQKLLEDQRRQMVELVDSLQKVTESNRQDQEKIRDVLEQKFSQIQENNEKKLDEMRQTVDEKLHNTLEKRLGESFKQVSERLEAVQRGLGEMQTLATGVGDLKRVLTNVKERGTWGEYQLEAILSEILTPDQYARNVKPKEGGNVSSLR